MSYGRLIVTRELTKQEAQNIEKYTMRSEDLSKCISIGGWLIYIDDIEVGTVGHNVQHITVRGRA